MDQFVVAMQLATNSLQETVFGRDEIFSQTRKSHRAVMERIDSVSKD